MLRYIVITNFKTKMHGVLNLYFCCRIIEWSNFVLISLRIAMETNEHIQELLVSISKQDRHIKRSFNKNKVKTIIGAKRRYTENERAYNECIDINDYRNKVDSNLCKLKGNTRSAQATSRDLSSSASDFRNSHVWFGFKGCVLSITKRSHRQST